jgi:hypothetical protein
MDYEILIPTNSNSTRGSYSANKDMYQNDTETIEAQLDRLNFTLLGLLKEDDNQKDFPGSFSFGADEPFDPDEDFIDKIDNFRQKYDRITMISEDFRSHEIRKEISSDKVFKTDCMLADLYKLKSNIKKNIELIEKNILNQVKITIGQAQIIVGITNQYLPTSKKKISLGFSQKSSEESNDEHNKQLENQIDDIKNHKFHSSSLETLEKSIFQSYSDSFPISFENFSTPHVPISNNSRISVELEYITMKQLNKHRENLIKNLEWENIQVKMLQQNYEQKLKELNNKETSMVQYITDIQLEISKKIKNIDLENSKNKQERERLNDMQKNISDKIKRIKENVSIIKENLNFNYIPCSSTNPALKNNADQVPEDPMQLELQITELESQLESCLDKTRLVFKINHLKNKLSVLRSERALNSKQTGKKFYSSNDYKNSCITPEPLQRPLLDLNIEFQQVVVPNTPRKSLPRTSTPVLQSGSALTLSCSQSNNNAFYDFTSSTPKAFLSTYSQNLDKETSLAKLLDIKQDRLRKTEEDLHKKEKKILETWMKTYNQHDIIKTLQTEITDCKNKSDILDKEYVNIDFFIKDTLDARRKIKNIEQMILSDMRTLKDKIENAEKLEDLCLEFIEFDF